MDNSTREAPPTENILVVLKVVRREGADHGHGDALLHDLLLQRLDAVLVLFALLLESLIGFLLKIEIRSSYDRGFIHKVKITMAPFPSGSAPRPPSTSWPSQPLGQSPAWPSTPRWHSPSPRGGRRHLKMKRW